jgi:flagellum-specific ATP synthase
MNAPHPLSQLRQFTQQQHEAIKRAPHSVNEGRVIRVSGLMVEVRGIRLPMGAQACIRGTVPGEWIDAECIGFDSDVTYLMAFENIQGLSPGTPVYSLNTPLPGTHGYEIREGMASLPIGHSLLGRVVDGFGRPLDGVSASIGDERIPFNVRINPLRRVPVNDPLDVGVRPINAMLTVGKGQRLGLFAGSGVGKSVLLAMLTRNASVDVTVVALVGERSREVREFLDDNFTQQSRARSVIVAAPADTSPLARVRAAEYASQVAAWFRDQGLHVLLVVDSLTRFALAAREIGLAMHEPPVARGYPASAFARLPPLLEMAGNSDVAQGSLTAFYTVLLEGDDSHDPVADAARGILDGHIFLSRTLADSGHYPAIDIEQSISRVMPKVVPDAHVQAARRLKQIVSKYKQNRDLLSLGAYVAGADPELDVAVRNWSKIKAFLQQDAGKTSDFQSSQDELLRLVEGLQ